MAGNFNPVSAIFRTAYFRNLQSIDRLEAVDFHPTSSGNFGGLNKWFFRWNHRFSFCQQASLKNSKFFKKCSTPQLVRFLNASSSWFRWFSFWRFSRKRDGFQKILEFGDNYQSQLWKSADFRGCDHFTKTRSASRNWWIAVQLNVRKISLLRQLWIT